MKKTIYVLSFLLSLFGSHQATFAIYNDYQEFCADAARDEKIFKSFKCDPNYRMVLEHVDKEQGREYLHFITAYYPHLFQKFDRFRENDLLGSPISYDYPYIGRISPTTLRYIKVLGDLGAYFGELDQKKIIEIGGGYGGQCLIISKLYSFKEYQIVDLLEPKMLTQKYLNLSKVPNFSCVTPAEIQENERYDLVISNYGFSEFERPFQNLYLEKVLKNSEHGYLTLNRFGSGSSLDVLTLEELVSILKSYGFTPQVFQEEPQTGHGVTNLILIW